MEKKIECEACGNVMKRDDKKKEIECDNGICNAMLVNKSYGRKRK